MESLNLFFFSAARAVAHLSDKVNNVFDWAHDVVRNCLVKHLHQLDLVALLLQLLELCDVSDQHKLGLTVVVHECLQFKLVPPFDFLPSLVSLVSHLPVTCFLDGVWRHFCYLKNVSMDKLCRLLDE